MQACALPIVLAGSASFVEPGRVRIASRDGEEILEADKVMIATGSRPRRPDSIPIDDHIIVDSGHSSMLFRKDVRQLVESFLRRGSFSK